MPYFYMLLCHILSFWYSGLNCELIHKVYDFSINLKISLVNSGGKPFLALKISVTNFCRFRYFEDFYIKIELLGQNRFDWIAFCWGEYCVFQTYIEFFFFFFFGCSWVFQFYSVEFFVKSEVKGIKFTACNLLWSAKIS